MKLWIFILFFTTYAVAQVFVPFSFRKGNAAPSISPSSPIYLLAGDAITVTASGGMGVYQFSNTGPAVADGADIVNDDNLDPTADYIARSTAYTTDTITVAMPGYANLTASVVTYNPISISPTTVTLGWGATQSFAGAGGCLNGTNCVGGAFAYSVASGGGSIHPTSGLFTSPSSDGTTVVSVADSIGNIASATITVTNSLTISPSTLNLSVFSTNTFSASLGLAPYTFSVFSGTGSIVPATGVYTAPAAIGSATVRVTDSVFAVSDSSVTIIEPIDVQVGTAFACALHNNGQVKCWGQNANGQLGIGSTVNIGDATTEVGGANAFLNLGTGRTATQISVGATHACALLDNSTVKCWGNGGNGRLGYGDTASRGDAANEMGDSLAAISLGTGLTPAEVYALAASTCVRFTTNQVKCFGSGGSGRLGNGNTSSIGDGAGEMGDSLAFVSLGTGRTATKIVGGNDFICALLDNSTVKCWGENQYGQLGKDSTADLGDGAGEMGDSLTAINIGAGRTALDIIAGYDGICVERDNSTAICWGRNNNGQVGIGSTAGANAAIGDATGEMAAIASINFNTGFGTLSELYSIGRSYCARDTLNVMKCWGRNTNGQLLLGSGTNQTSVSATASSFGTGLVVSKLAAKLYTGCALFTNKRIKCWGKATDSGNTVASGVHLNGTSTGNLGDAAGEIGNSLNYVNH